MIDVRDLNRRVKRWPGWAVLLVVLVGFVAVGAARDTGPRTQQDRIDAIAQRLACPTCDGESVYESRASSSESIRREIARMVAAGQLSDDEIVASLAARFGAEVLLVPRSTGIEALVWALPVTALVLAVAGLAVAFRRWRQEAAGGHDISPRDGDAVGACESAVGACESKEGSAAVVPQPPRRWWVGAAWMMIVLAVALGAGVLVARHSGERLPGRFASGDVQVEGVSGLLSRARALLNPAEPTAALELYARVLELEPDNVEALTYIGWLSVLSAVQERDPERQARRVESGLVLLRQVTIQDPTYADARCFLAIALFRFLEDAEAARSELEACQAANPPAEVAELVDGLAAEIEAARG